MDDLVAQINIDLYEGRNYRVVIPAKVLKIYDSDFLGRYVFNEELSVNLVGAKSTESASEFSSNIAEGQKVSHIGVVSFYTNSDVNATDDAKLELRKGKETVATAPVRVAKEEGYSHIYADFSGEDHKLLAIDNDAAYAAVLPKGTVVDAANENLLNKEYSVAFNGLDSPVVIPEKNYYDVTLTIDNAVAQTSAVEEGKTVDFVLTPADELWVVESVDNATLVGDKWATAPVESNLNVKAHFALAKEVDFDFSVGVNDVMADCKYRVYSEGDRLMIDGLTPGDRIRVYTVGGSLIADRTVPDGMDMVRVTLDPDFYIIAINNTTIKVKH